jgi:LysM repeat protein
MAYARRSPLRFLAPVALIAFGIALMMVVSSSKGTSGGGKTSSSEQAKQRDLGSGVATKKPRRRATGSGKLPSRYYTVKSGDTLLSISGKVGIPVAKLQELNPQLDPQQLVSGQKIKLRQ